MHALILTTCLLTAPQTTDANTAIEQPDPAEAVSTVAASTPADDRANRRRHAYELRQNTSELLKREAISTGDNRRAAVFELIAWYCKLQQDQRITDRERDRLAPRVRARLVHIAKRIQRQRTHRQRASSDVRAVGQHSTTADGSDANAEVVIDTDILAQFGGAAGAGGGNGQGGFAGAGGGILGVNDDGGGLVDLIQTVISPETWNVNGGPGAIYYYRPLRVLVISAPG